MDALWVVVAVIAFFGYFFAAMFFESYLGLDAPTLEGLALLWPLLIVDIVKKFLDQRLCKKDGHVSRIDYAYSRWGRRGPVGHIAKCTRCGNERSLPH